MSEKEKPRTAELNGRFWGASSEDWADIQEATCRAVYIEVLAKLNLSEKDLYLDAGCGSGMAAELASEQGLRVHGIDASSSLIDIASRRTPNGIFKVGDLEELPFDDSMFDAVTGFNSFQYAGNPITALREAKRVAKPDATVVIMTWGQPDGMEAASLVAALAPLLPPPPPGAPGPFALSDESALRNFAGNAGLVPIQVVDVQSPWVYSDLETAKRGLRSSGVAARAIENSSLEAVDRANANALEPFLQTDGSYRIGANFKCLFTKA